ncbi:hypothetical protein UCRPA7_6802 [Phaeoacremonium minimum UCRPA7]|uniref:Uncharacterized protein n=1 Tax=Phaeoacremonium minimum (strain UCR-PA7) TaxID=1286976 RepID=R8BEI1_PHAM7|nr:hypothetical protein UCRPA7_6802 [Phaeoacremonium minimum UCRPA7]EON97703.1 hypothetical protein UCRPA7_6802 [Phaeoacremonium minimum UCRPA7]
MFNRILQAVGMASIPSHTKPRKGSKESEFDNSGDGPLLVPGFNGIIVNRELEGRNVRFTHGVNEWGADRLTVREVAMLQLMDAITDKPSWHVKIFNEEIVKKWHDEATAKPLISEKAWEWVVAELRDKARDFEKTGKVFTYDTGSRIVKADSVVTEELREELIGGVKSLLEVPEDQKDYHPGSNNQVLNLVHPSLFPLVYGRSRVLSKGGRTDIKDVVASCGLGQVAEVTGPESQTWSRRFQWLPCEVAFSGEKGTTDVEITSYINNLHPAKHQGLYHTIEKLLKLSIPLWNDVLIKDNHGRTPLRIETFGGEVEPESPEWVESVHLPKSVKDKDFPEFFEKVRAYLSLPDRPGYVADPDDEDEDEDSDEDQDDNEEVDLEAQSSDERTQAEQVGDQLLRRLTRMSEDPNTNKYEFIGTIHEVIDRKWKRIRQIVHPEPGTAVTYEQWKQGLQASIVPKSEWSRTEEEKTKQFQQFRFYDVNIHDDFRESGLQIIVKLASIELTPERPDYEGGNWHVEGMQNEHIVATAIYYYDVDNVTDARLAFRQEAKLDDMSLVYEQDEHEPLEVVFGTNSMRDEPAVQELGSVTTPQGRLLAFPNTLQHRVGNFSLADKTKPGHRRFIVLWLVDPHYRVCSTRNVPIQRHDWWAEERLDTFDFGKLPAEMVNMVRDNVEDWPMGLEEAKKLRLDLMQERTRMTSAVEQGFEEYNLCEH